MSSDQASTNYINTLADAIRKRCEFEANIQKVAYNNSLANMASTIPSEIKKYHDRVVHDNYVGDHRTSLSFVGHPGLDRCKDLRELLASQYSASKLLFSCEMTAKGECVRVRGDKRICDPNTYHLVIKVPK